MLRSEDVGAFTEFMGVAGRLETAPIVPVTAYSPLLALTRGLANVIPAGGTPGLPPQAALPAAERLTLPDGRLNVGTHLPLLARRYRYLSTLGEGVSAQVILAEDTLAPAAGQLVAIKVMRRQHGAAGQREARALRFLHAAAPGGTAPGVVQLLDTFSLGAHYCLVLERLYPWLLDWVAASAAAPPAAALRALRKLSHQLLLAVACLHNRGVVHADIKPDNLLLCGPPGSSSLALRLTDFGAAFSLTETDTAAVGCEVQTLPYRAPEAALALPYGAAVDLWSVGVVMAELALKRALLPAASTRELLHGQAALLGPLPAAMVAASPVGAELGLPCGRAQGSPAAEQAAATPRLPRELAAAAAAAVAAESSCGALRAPWAACPLAAELAAVDVQLADLVLGLLRYDPAYRLTAHQALLHPFFDSLCPLRAAFPQLTELCAAQQAALHAQAYSAPTAVPVEQAKGTAAATEEAQAGTGQQQAAAAATGAAIAAGAAAVQAPKPAQARPLSLAAAAEAEAAEAVAAAHLPAPDGQRRQQAAEPTPALGARDIQAGQQQQPDPSEAGSSGQQRWPQAEWEGLQQPALPRPRAPPAQLPAARLAARQREEQRRLAAAQPYAGQFWLDDTPAKQAVQASAAQPPGAADQQPAAQQQWRQEEQQEEQRQRQRQQQAGAPPLPASQAGHASHGPVGAPAGTAREAAGGGEGQTPGGSRQERKAEPVAASAPAAAAAVAAFESEDDAGIDIRGSLHLLLEAAAAGEARGRERHLRRQQAQRPPRGTPAAKASRGKPGAGGVAASASAAAVPPKQEAATRGRHGGERPRQLARSVAGSSGSPARRSVKPGAQPPRASLGTKTPARRRTPGTQPAAAAAGAAARTPEPTAAEEERPIAGGVLAPQPPAAERKRKHAPSGAKDLGTGAGSIPPSTDKKSSKPATAARAAGSPVAEAAAASQPPATAAKRARRDQAEKVPWWVVQG